MADKNFEVRKGLTVANTVIVTSGSNVGIGNTAPEHTLSVNGPTYLQGNLIIQSAIIAGGVFGTNGQILVSNGTTLYWTTLLDSGIIPQVYVRTDAENVFTANNTFQTVNAVSFTIGSNLTANSLGVYSNNINATTFSIGSIFKANTITFNSNGITVNSTGAYVTGLTNSSSFTVGTSTVSNSTGVYTGVVNGSSITVGTSTVSNSTGVYTGVVNAASHTVGTSTIANSTGVYTGVVNATSHTVGTSTIANSTGVYTGVVNATSHTVGTSTIANSTGVYTGVVNATTLVTTTNTVTVGTASYFVSNGNLGVGTSSPSATLDVSGSVSIAKANVLSQTLTDAATISWDTSLGQVATVTLGGNRTMAAPTNLKVGTLILHVIQDGTGGRTISWNSVFKWPAGVAPTLTTTANRRDLFSFVCDGTNLYGAFLPDVR